MPSDPENGLHANSLYGVPTDGGGPTNCFSRSDILEGSTPAAFGSEQSMEICTEGEDPDNPATLPKDWHAAGLVLRVPKCVILSSFPFWTLYWPKTYFYYARDVFGDDGFGNLVNYYYFDQWNGLDEAAAQEYSPDYSFIAAYDDGDTSGYGNNRTWKDLSFLDPADKATVYNARAQCQALDKKGELHCEEIPGYLITKCLTPPTNERYFECVLVLQNPYYVVHPRLLETFRGAKAILEKDADPIYVSIPNWLPPVVRQLRNSYLKQNHEKTRDGHGGGVNGQPCAVVDSVPCYTGAALCWAPPYPDKDDPRNQPGFECPQVPWLLSADPGFGTNTLHLYIGHPVVSYSPSSNFYDFQAWPLTPEVQWLAGPIYTGGYLGDPNPFFVGRRPVWRTFGYDYGYVNHGAEGLWESRYSGIVTGAAETYKENFWKYRMLGTRIFTYDVKWDWTWNLDAIRNDMRADCPSSAFYFGDLTFDEYVASLPDEAASVIDCQGMSPQHLKIAEKSVTFPAPSEIDAAQKLASRALVPRVMQYYEGNDPGSGKFFDLAIAHTGLAGYNVTYEGKMPGSFLDVDGLVAYIRQYFAENP